MGVRELFIACSAVRRAPPGQLREQNTLSPSKKKKGKKASVSLCDSVHGAEICESSPPSLPLTVHCAECAPLSHYLEAGGSVP